MNSNELFKTYIVNTLQMVARGILTGVQAQEGINGYYKALEDMKGTDELTTLYNHLSYYALSGTVTQSENARNILKGNISITDLLDK